MLQPSHTRLVSSTEHPQDVLTIASQLIDDGKKCALVLVTGILGGAVRARGAQMLVDEDGQHWGYVSGGCIDADVKLQAMQSIKNNSPKTLRYGEGSPFYDLKLPCGGAIEISICPNPDSSEIANTLQTLASRQAASIFIDTNGRFKSTDQSSDSQTSDIQFSITYNPKMKLRIAGRGADPIALFEMAKSAGMLVELWSPDEDTILSVSQQKNDEVLHLKNKANLPQNKDDNWTAFVLMFHDSQWETALLQQALAGDAFYVGAVGSKKTHAKRCETLRNSGISEQDIQKIHGPIGLVPSLRDASTLAISTLAQIIAEFQKAHKN